MTVQYWAPLFRTMICLSRLQKYGLEGWRTAVTFIAMHEVCADRPVQGFETRAMKPFNLGRAMCAADYGKNVRKPRPWDW